MSARMIIGDTRDVVASLPDGSVDLVVTSPPFLALRSYLPADHVDKHREIGSEATPADFLDTLLDLAELWRTKLAPHGSICVELGDTYSGSGGSGGDYNEGGLRDGQASFSGSAAKRAKYSRGEENNRPSRVGRRDEIHHRGGDDEAVRTRAAGKRDKPYPGWPLSKSLCGIPTLFTWSLAYGRNLLNPDHTFEPWRIRNLLVWARSNPPVGSLGDKFRPATSYITVACPSASRWFDLDAVRTPYSENSHARVPAGSKRPNTLKTAPEGNRDTLAIINNEGAGAPPLDWVNDIWDEDGPTGDRLWWMNTAPYSGSHYATFPSELPARLVQAMCPPRVCTTCGDAPRRITTPTPEYSEQLGKSIFPKNETLGDRERRGRSGAHGHFSADRVTSGWTDCGHDGWRNGLVLDPFGGTGTTGLAATGAGRDAVLVDIDDRNIDLARQRIGMFLEVEHHQETAA